MVFCITVAGIILCEYKQFVMEKKNYLKNYNNVIKHQIET